MNSKRISINNILITLVSICILLVFDQFTKLQAVIHLKDQDPFIIINKVFQLYYLENHGAAFGILQNQKFFFVIMAMLIIAALGYVYFMLPAHKKYLPIRIISIFICAGAIGNLIDRIRFNYVIDFFYFNLIDFPIFNVADIYITVSTFILIFMILFYYKEEDFEVILRRRK